MTPTGGPRAVRAAGSTRDPRLLPAGAALVVAALLAMTVAGVGPRLARDPLLLALLGYLAYWVPLVVVAAWASWKRFARAADPLAQRDAAVAPRDTGRFRIRFLDVLLGVGAGLIARSAATLVELAVYGRALVAGAQPTIDGVGPSPALVALTMIVAPLVLAPVVEEWFFRGTLLPALRGPAPGAPTGPSSAVRAGRASIAVAVAASALIFALMHLFAVTTVTAGVVTGLSAFALGLATGILAATTGRLVAPVAAHVVFNATVLIPALL